MGPIVSILNDNNLTENSKKAIEILKTNCSNNEPYHAVLQSIFEAFIRENVSQIENLPLVTFFQKGGIRSLILEALKDDQDIQNTTVLILDFIKQKTHQIPVELVSKIDASLNETFKEFTEFLYEFASANTSFKNDSIPELYLDKNISTILNLTEEFSIKDFLRSAGILGEKISILSKTFKPLLGPFFDIVDPIASLLSNITTNTAEDISIKELANLTFKHGDLIFQTVEAVTKNLNNVTNMKTDLIDLHEWAKKYVSQFNITKNGSIKVGQPIDHLIYKFLNSFENQGMVDKVFPFIKELKAFFSYNNNTNQSNNQALSFEHLMDIVESLGSIFNTNPFDNIKEIALN